MKINKWLNEAGLNRNPISIDEIKKIEPTINIKNVYGGFYTMSDMTGDIHLFTKQLSKVCMKNGAKFNFRSYGFI